MTRRPEADLPWAVKLGASGPVPTPMARKTRNLIGQLEALGHKVALQLAA